MLVLLETPAGYAIFKLLDESKLSRINYLHREFNTPEGAASVVELKNFIEFETMIEAFDAAFAAIEGKVSKTLKKALKDHVCIEDRLLVGDAKLGRAIKDKFGIQCLSNSNVRELLRCIRLQIDSLLKGTLKEDMTTTALGLSHSLPRYKSTKPDKLDTMIFKAQQLLDDMDKELNDYIKKSRECGVFKQLTAADGTRKKKSIKRKRTPQEAKPAKNIKIENGSGVEVTIEKKKNVNKSIAPEEKEAEADIPSKKISLAPEATEENNEVPAPSSEKKKKKKRQSNMGDDKIKFNFLYDLMKI